MTSSEPSGVSPPKEISRKCRPKKTKRSSELLIAVLKKQTMAQPLGPLVSIDLPLQERRLSLVGWLRSAAQTNDIDDSVRGAFHDFADNLMHYVVEGPGLDVPQYPNASAIRSLVGVQALIGFNGVIPTQLQQSATQLMGQIVTELNRLNQVLQPSEAARESPDTTAPTTIPTTAETSAQPLVPYDVSPSSESSDSHGEATPEPTP